MCQEICPKAGSPANSRNPPDFGAEFGLSLPTYTLVRNIGRVGEHGAESIRPPTSWLTVEKVDLPELGKVNRSAENSGQMLERDRVDIAAEDVFDWTRGSKHLQTATRCFEESTAAETWFENRVAGRADRPVCKYLAQLDRCIERTDFPTIGQAARRLR